MHGGKLVGANGCSVRSVCADPSQCQCSVSSDNGRSPLPAVGNGKGDCF